VLVALPLFQYEAPPPPPKEVIEPKTLFDPFDPLFVPMPAMAVAPLPPAPTVTV
jgi:hypothetical protein